MAANHKRLNILIAPSIGCELLPKLVESGYSPKVGREVVRKKILEGELPHIPEIPTYEYGCSMQFYIMLDTGLARMLEDMVTVYKAENPDRKMSLTAAVRTLFIFGMLEHYASEETSSTPAV